jgi:hypothetical protein
MIASKNADIATKSSRQKSLYNKRVLELRPDPPAATQ